MEKAKALILNFFFLATTQYVYLASEDEYRKGYLSILDHKWFPAEEKPHDKLSSYKEIRANIISLAIKIEYKNILICV